MWNLCTADESDICVLVMTLTSVYWWWIWHLCTCDESDICVLVMNLTSVYWWWSYYLCTGDGPDICVLMMNWKSVYWRWFWHLCTGGECDICVLVMELLTVYWCWIWHLCTDDGSPLNRTVDLLCYSWLIIDDIIVLLMKMINELIKWENVILIEAINTPIRHILYKIVF